tara:strand:+ start:7978 stop:8328 length:351 start_codon:yes stop_codon:yes gene_type:complete
MANDIKIEKTVYTKEEFDKVVDRDFKTFAQPALAVVELTVDEFFNEYERLYMDITVNGPEESHEYLVKRSNELVGIDKETEDIQPLLDEIANLRENLLQNQQEILDLNTKLANARG